MARSWTRRDCKILRRTSHGSCISLDLSCREATLVKILADSSILSYLSDMGTHYDIVAGWHTIWADRSQQVGRSSEQGSAERFSVDAPQEYWDDVWAVKFASSSSNYLNDTIKPGNTPLPSKSWPLLMGIRNSPYVMIEQCSYQVSSCEAHPHVSVPWVYLGFLSSPCNLE